MKIKLLLLSAILFLLAQISTAQSHSYLYSSFPRPVQNKQDSLLLIRNEQKMWTAAGKGNVMAFDNPMIDCEFKVKMSAMAIKGCLQDSIAFKSGASLYLMNLMENRSADTCYLMSFSPYLSYQYRERVRWVQDSITNTPKDTTSTGSVNVIGFHWGHWEMSDWKTGSGVRLLMPLSAYPAVIPEKEMAKMNVVYQKQFAAQLNGQLSGDTIYRTVRFTRDSNEYLPQAPYANLLVMMKNFTLMGATKGYASKDLLSPMSKYAMECIYASWDSTNQVEDPNNPGVFIHTPIKIEGQVKSLLICEKWVPFHNVIGNGNWIPQPYVGYRRIVTAYGMLLTTGKTIWFSPAELNNALAKYKFNMIPYEECFRAERFKTLQILLHTW